MAQFIPASSLITLFFACEKTDEISDACITSCPPSVPGKINLAIEDHTTFDISSTSTGLRIQLVEAPGCISDAN